MREGLATRRDVRADRLLSCQDVRAAIAVRERLAGTSGGSVTVDAFLASSVFRAGLVPLASVTTITMAKWATRRDDSTEKLWEIFAIGPDLLMAAVIAIPAFITEKAAALAASPTRSKDLGSVESSGWVYLLVFWIVLGGLTYERQVAKTARQKEGKRRPLILGVLVPILFGSLAIGATFGLVR
jgi:hypothetical protein